MAQHEYATSGQVLAQAEQSIGTAMKTAMIDHYEGTDLDKAQAIRLATTSEEAARLVTELRRGRAIEVLMVAGSAIAGVVAGVISQKVVGNFTIKKVPPVGILGLVPAGIGLAAPVGLAGRSALAAGGLGYATGTVLYSLIVPQEATL